MRRVSFEVPTDTTMFSPTQLQPRALFGLAMSAWARWLKECLVPFRELIRDYSTGIVVLAIGGENVRPLRFFDTDTLTITAGWRASLNGALMEGDFGVFSEGEKVAQAVTLLRPVRLHGSDSLAATPSRLPRSLLEKLLPDEVSRERPVWQGAALVETLEKAPAIAIGQHALMIHRNDCEVADQWSFIEMPRHAANARESLALTGEADELRLGLSKDVASIDVQLFRPMYFLDEGIIETKACMLDGRLTFFHKFKSGEQTHALVTEQMTA